MPDWTALAASAATAVAERTGVPRHTAAAVLGSGWGVATEHFDQVGRLVAEVPTSDLPGFLAPAAPGHAGTLRSYDLDGVAVLVFLGRTHLFEGHGQEHLGAVVHGVRTAAAAGCHVAVLTNASGSLRSDWTPGTGVLIADHLNLSGRSPLVGAQFVDLTECWNPRLRAAARALDPTLVEGVYAMMRGPSVQTAAETRMLRVMGADVVGMSTVPEAIAARAAGMELLGLSASTTVEGSGEALDPEAVVAVAESTARRLAPVIANVLRAQGTRRTTATAKGI